MVSFVKAHACGNDFLVMDESDAQGRHAELARKLCARNTGIGADGIEFLERRGDKANFLRLFNADGSEAELSGNGTRCVAAWLAFSEGLKEVAFETRGGGRACRVVQADGTRFEIESWMGIPQVAASRANFAGIGEVEGAIVDVGNPHFVVFCEGDDFRSHGMDWTGLGEAICASPNFPQGTNVEFVRMAAPDHIEIRIFERGVGPTSSSGTGTCAAASAAIALKGASRSLLVQAPGGSQRIEWPSNDAPIRLTGPAEIICWGGKAAGL